ncbi:photosystem II 5 kD protein [Striga asiatica]|uniref:Photosystem II 5 kD protein n=1 Tax=Striga asiatica TaxID=4170 RepID=A0A5A7Q852_STRAF|nr:photosystem II 5 kD protein [Striga asiatica]
MASITMTASFLGSSAAKNLSTTSRRGMVAVRASSSGSEEKTAVNRAEEGKINGRRDLMFAVAAAAVCSAAKVAMAAEPKPGTSDAKKKYGPICVSMPTARICRN